MDLNTLALNLSAHDAEQSCGVLSFIRPTRRTRVGLLPTSAMKSRHSNSLLGEAIDFQSF
jgi:hypothetical protein